MLVLLGIAVVVLGFVLRANPLLVVMAAAITTGLAAAWTAAADLTVMWNAALGTLAIFGKAFNDNRIIAIVWIVLPVIGLLERHGLRERATATIRRFKAATAGRLLVLYLLFRQVTAALGLNTIAGHPQTVRPLVAPMALAAAEQQHNGIEEESAEEVKAFAAATDNVGNFFGEDIFIAIGSIVLIQSTLAGYGYNLAPLDLAIWAIPTAIAAFLIHGFRLLRLDRRLKRRRK